MSNKGTTLLIKCGFYVDKGKFIKNTIMGILDGIWKFYSESGKLSYKKDYKGGEIID